LDYTKAWGMWPAAFECWIGITLQSWSQSNTTGLDC
jgi:hypothetical protein